MVIFLRKFIFLRFYVHEVNTVSKCEIIWFKGKVIPSKDAMVNVMSPTSQFGLNVFEGIRGYWNEQQQQLYIFRLDDHLDRLFESCKLLSLDPVYSKDDIKSYINDLLIEADFTADIAIRLTLFVDGDGSWNSLDAPDLFISPMIKLRKDISQLTGSSACISSWQRISDVSMPPRAKAGANYIAGRYAHLEANRANYDLPIYLNSAGKVAEGAGACIFMVRDNSLITPTLQSSILESITRDTLIKLAEELGIEVFVREIDRTELLISDEVFLCGSATEITPITSINSIPVKDGKPGAVTIRLLKKYQEILTNQDNSNLPVDWLTLVT